MDQGLFGKYNRVVLERKNKVEEIIDFIKKETGATIEKDEVVLKKNTVSFQVSSVKKVVLQKKSIKDFLEGKGYIVII